jgi:NAD(P) transhydrogenase
MAEEYDVIVIGSGPAGARGAEQAAALGKRVALIEREPHLGGRGINTGTMPSKMLRETALYMAGLRQRGLFGIEYSLQDGLAVGDLLYRKDVVIEGAWGLIRRNLERANIHIVWGEGRLADAHTVVVRQLREEGPRDMELSAGVILIATGASPRRPPGVPFDDPRVCDAESILSLPRIPGSLVVCGGGTIGCEYAAIFSALGSQVTLVESRDRVLTFVDAEIAQRWQRHQERVGVNFVFGSDVLAVEPGEDEVRLRLANGLQLQAEAVLFAIGREGNIVGLGLEALGVALADGGTIAVNDNYQTSLANVYAAGDVIGFPALASTSMEQGRQAMLHAFGASGGQPARSVYPLGVYTLPEIAMAGLSEEACQAGQVAYQVGRGFFANNPRAQITGDTDGMIKLVFSPEDRRLLGVHVLGEQAAELVHLGAQVLSSGGGLDALVSAVYNYPTLTETYKQAAIDGLARLQQRSD